MIKNKKAFNDAASTVLSEDGMILEASAQVYIRRLEGPVWCVGLYDREGDMVKETLHDNDLESALQRFHQLVDKYGLA